MKTNIDYWDKFYSGVDLKLKIPSQFAAFVAMEYLDKVNTILDIGCGNGRDSVFFSSLGFRVIGIDASKKALEQIKKNSYLNAKFFVGDISDKTLRDILEKNISSEGKNLIYSRFFLHAISDKIEEDFWNLANSLTSKGDFMALEFRNEKDEKLIKSTPDHYRIFVNSKDFTKMASNFGFMCNYQIEGFGYAKYKNDNANVSRLLLEKK